MMIVKRARQQFCVGKSCHETALLAAPREHNRMPVLLANAGEETKSNPQNFKVMFFFSVKSLSRCQRSPAEIVDIFQDGGDERLRNGSPFFARGERGVAPSSRRRIGAFAVWVAS